MAEGTATAELDTAPAPAEATEPQAPDSALPEETETDTSSEATTDSDDTAQADEEAPEEEQPLTREEHEKILKAERAKLEESFRQKSENAARQAQEEANKRAYSQNVTRSQQMRADNAYQQMSQIVNAVIARRENGEDVNVSPQWLAQVASQQADAAFWDQDSALEAGFRAWASRNGYRPDAELTAALDRAMHLHPSDPNRITARFDARMALLEAAARESLEPKLREEIEAKVRAELGAAGKAAAMKENDATRAAVPKPTGVGIASAPPLRITSMDAADDAYSNGRISHAKYKELREKFGVRN